MPDRAIIPLLPAASLGFICGIISSALLLGDAATALVGVAGAVLTAAAAFSSVLGVRADPGEKAIVAALRAATAVGLFVAVYLFILSFLGEGKLGVAMIWLVLAIVLGLVLSRLAVRDRPERREGHEPEAA